MYMILTYSSTLHIYLGTASRRLMPKYRYIPEVWYAPGIYRHIPVYTDGGFSAPGIAAVILHFEVRITARPDGPLACLLAPAARGPVRRLALWRAVDLERAAARAPQLRVGLLGAAREGFE